MDKHTLKVLEYKDVVEIIARKSTNIYGREMVEKREPMEDPMDIAEFQAETAEAIRIFDSTEPFTVGSLEDIRPIVDMAVKDIPLQPGEILQVFDVAERARLLKKYLSGREVMAKRLREKSQFMTIFADLEKIVKKSIGREGNILDGATPRLHEIRRVLNTLHNRIHSHLEQFLKDSQYRVMLQEPIITRREHRYVLPVKQEYRAQFPGLALDSSASGATIFMEPTSVLKLTNEYKFQMTEEKREEEQIRLSISRMIARDKEELLDAVQFLGYYDSLQASARFYYDNNCILPRISDRAMLDLRHARHPLLGDKAVPIEMRIGGDFFGLIVTGPNTGGKTVSLKTTGLLTLLALSGFPIPAGEGSIVGIFTEIFADIGDEQSISQNLSTFSSHLTQIIRMAPHVNERSLILLDEIGAGTDPSEGVALASAVLRYMVGNKARVIATTHYNELKIFAAHNDEFVNAAVEFDEETLQPTYRIIIGLPGRSCALKIAQRLGLYPPIVNEAREILGKEYMEIDTLLSEIDREKIIAQKESREAGQARVEMEKLRSEYEEKLKNVEAEREKLLQEARLEGKEFVENVLRELKDARKMWRASLKEGSRGKKSADEIREDEKKVKSSLDRAVEKLRKFHKKEEKIEAAGDVSFSEGDLVHIASLNRRGRVIHMVDSHSALVQVDNIKMEFPAMNLEKVELDNPAGDVNVGKIRTNKALSISSRMDIRGMRVEEALGLLEKYIDDAALANLESFQVVHGKGTGALRQAVQEYLRTHPSVKSLRDGELHEGGWGVTVVNF